MFSGAGVSEQIALNGPVVRLGPAGCEQDFIGLASEKPCDLCSRLLYGFLRIKALTVKA